MLSELAAIVLSLAKRDGIGLTPMKLVKLCYILNGWYLGFHGKPLFNERIEAWRYGPVMPELYHSTKIYGRDEIPFDFVSNFEQTKSKSNYKPKELNFIERIYAVYKNKTAIELSMLTHTADSPWSQVYKKDIPGIEIPVDLIKVHYEQKIKSVQSS